jgi:hypothetical protein
MIGDPGAETGRVLAFLGEDFEPGCLDISSLEWRQNSSFGEAASEIVSTSVGRWRGSLDPKEVAAIEERCADLMALFDYDRTIDAAAQTGKTGLLGQIKHAMGFDKQGAN